MDVLQDKVVKTKKEHRCSGCARKFPKGTALKCVKVADEGRIYTDYWCPVCMEYWKRYMNSDDQIGYGDLKSEDNEGWESVRKEVEDNC